MPAWQSTARPANSPAVSRLVSRHVGDAKAEVTLWVRVLPGAEHVLRPRQSVARRNLCARPAKVRHTPFRSVLFGSCVATATLSFSSPRWRCHGHCSLISCAASTGCAARPRRRCDGAEQPVGWGRGETYAPRRGERPPEPPPPGRRFEAGGPPSPRAPPVGGSCRPERIAGVRYLTDRAATPGRCCLGYPHPGSVG